MYCHSVTCRSSVRVIDRRKYGKIRAAEQTSFGTAGVAVSGNVDGFIYFNGNIVVSGADLGSKQRNNITGTEIIYIPAACKLFMVNILF